MVVTARQSTSLAGRDGLDRGRTRELALDLAPHVPALRALRRRHTLERSDLYARLRDDIDRVTAGVEGGRADAVAPVHAPGFLRVAAWNLERGRQLDGIARFATESALLRRVDVLLAPEVDIGMARSGNRDVAAELAASLGMHYAFGNSYLCLDAGNATDWEGDFRPEPNRVGLHGNAIFSRFPIARAENVSLPVTKDKFESSEKRLGHKKALCAELDTPFGPLPVAVVHLDSGASPSQRAQQMARVVDVLGERGSERALIGGDFNTTTYDLKSPWRLVRNLASKYARGGFEHALHHYVHPHELYERPLFEELDRAGFDYGPAFNTPATGTTRYDVEDEHARRKVREYMPAFVLDYLRRKLQPFGGVAPVRLDWFAARGLRGLDAGEATDGDGTASIAPTVVHRPSLDGSRLSDHDIIVVDVLFDDASGVRSPG